MSSYNHFGKGLGLSISGLHYLELLIEKKIKPVEQDHKIFVELQELRNKLSRSLDRSVLEKKDRILFLSMHGLMFMPA